MHGWQEGITGAGGCAEPVKNEQLCMDGQEWTDVGAMETSGDCMAIVWVRLQPQGVEAGAWESASAQ